RRRARQTRIGFHRRHAGESRPARRAADDTRGERRELVRIERAVLRELEAELRAPFRTGRGTVSKRRVLLVTLEGEGVESWAECVAGVDPSATESVERAWSVLTEALLPGVVGHRFARPADLVTRLRVPEDARASRAALEMAVQALVA